MSYYHFFRIDLNMKAINYVNFILQMPLCHMVILLEYGRYIPI